MLSIREYRSYVRSHCSVSTTQKYVDGLRLILQQTGGEPDYQEFLRCGGFEKSLDVRSNCRSAIRSYGKMVNREVDTSEDIILNLLVEADGTIPSPMGYDYNITSLKCLLRVLTNDKVFDRVVGNCKNK